MRVIKPFPVGLLTRCVEHRKRIGMVITATVYFPFTPAGEGTAWSEMSMWSYLGEEMPEGPLIDEGMLKVRSEYLVHGSAFAPGGGATQCDVGARVGGLVKTLRVFGPRLWINGRASDPLPFTRLPLDWAHAYGGPDFAANPTGTGRVTRKLEGAQVHLLPQVELATSPSLRPSAEIEPASFGRIDMTWPQRAQYRGTYDEHWLEEHSPGFAGDIDWRFFNMAPSDQWSEPAFTGDEPFSFVNMHPTKARVEGHLPNLRVRCFTGAPDAGAPNLRESAMRLSTVWFFPHAERGVMLFQALVPCTEDDGSDIQLLMLGLERGGAPRSDEHYAHVLARRLDPRSGALQSLRESDLVPEGMASSDPNFEAIQSDYRPEGLMGQAQRRGAELHVAAARDEAKALGMDPDAMKLVVPPPLKVPTLEELPDFVERVQAAALNAQVTSLLDAVEQLQAAREQAKRAGIDPDELVHRGPPRYRAEQHLAELRAAAAAGARAADGKPLDLDALAGQVRRVEALERSAYLATAHEQPPARRMPPAHAAVVRQAVISAHANGQSLMAADLTGADLSKLDLRGADFTGAWLESADLSGALLMGCSFASAVLAHADFSAADVSDADLSGANLGKAKLATARFVGASLASTNFTATALAQTDLRKATIDAANLRGATFGLADWRQVKGKGLLFHKAALDGLVLRHAELVQPQFIDCDLSGVDFSGAMLDRPTFIGCRGQNVRFTGARLPGAVFVEGCRFDGADFAGAGMKGSNLRETRLVGADFSGADLDECDLSGAALDGARLGRASLRKALATKTSLRGASLADANCMEAILQRADLRGTRLDGANLFGADLSRVRTDAATSFLGALAQRARLHPRRPVEELA